jgi:hypothetical protein
MKEHRLRRIFGPKRDEVTGEWRKLHNQELQYIKNDEGAAVAGGGGM